MVIPNWLFKLLALLGLVDSEEKKIKNMIAVCKDEQLRLRSLLEDQIREVEAIEREIRKLQPKYEEAQGPAKGAYAEMIKPLLQKRNSMEQKQRLLSDNIKAVTAQLATLENLRDVPGNPERTAALERLTMQMQDLNDDMRDQNSALADLEKTQYKGGSQQSTLDLSEFSAAAPARSEEDLLLEKELAEVCGSAVPASSSKTEDKIEA